MSELRPDRPLVIDLFAGAGGLSLGFEQAGYDVAAAVELDPVHAAVHEFNFPYATTICADVSTLTGDSIRERSGVGSREVHAVVGGAPCQGFSMIGKRQLDDPRNRLVAEFIRIVLEIRPRYFVLENVAGLTVGKHRMLLDEAIALVEAGGYRVRQPYQVLQAADFGVPQSRKRLFLVGARSDVPLPHYPAPTYVGRSIRGSVTDPKDGMPVGPSVSDALGDVPDADSYEALLTADETEAQFGTPSRYASVLSGVATDPGDFSRVRPYPQNRLTSSTRTSHTDLSRSRFAQTPPGTTETVSRFLRLHPDGVANTLRAGTASDRGAHTSPRPIHPTAPRVITVREAARLHSYPDWFRFHVTKWHGFRQIGNSVPPLLARAVASALISADALKPEVGPRTPLGDVSLLSLNGSEASKYFGFGASVIPQRSRRTSEALT